MHRSMIYLKCMNKSMMSSKSIACIAFVEKKLKGKGAFLAMSEIRMLLVEWKETNF